MKLLLGTGVSSLIDSLNWKADVVVRTTADVVLAAPGANLDGVAMLAGQRFMAAGQAAPAENGIYIWNGAAVPATRSSDANVAAELVNATASVEAGTSAGLTFRQSTPAPIVLGVTALAFVPFGSGDVTGPAGATLNALAAFADATGKVIKNSLAILSVAGALLLPGGTAALPAYSPLAGAGLYSDAANTVKISTATVERLAVSTTAITSTLPINAPAGLVGDPGLRFSSEATGFRLIGAGNLGLVIAGADSWNLLASTMTLPSAGYNIFHGTVNTALVFRTASTTTATVGYQITNLNSFTGSAAAQTHVQIAHSINQTGTAGMTSLKIVRTETALGSAAQTFLDFYGGVGGATQVYAVTNLGQVLAGAGSVSAPAISAVGDPNSGFNFSGDVISYVVGGSNVLNMRYVNPQAILYANSTGVGVAIWGLSTSGTVAGVSLGNGTSGATEFVGSSGVQTGTLSDYYVNQTSTAAFTNMRIVSHETAVGSGAQSMIDCYAGATGVTQVFQVLNTGVARGPNGASTAPTWSFLSFPNTGYYASSSTTTHISLNANLTYSFTSSALTFNQGNIGLYANAVGAAYFLGGNWTTQVDGPIYVKNLNAFTASTAVQQKAFRLYAGVNQTSTASFALLYGNLSLSSDGVTGDPVFGTGGGMLVDLYRGLVRKFTVTDHGAIGNAAVSPAALAAGNTDDYAGIGTYGAARITSNAAGSTLRSVVAPVEGRYLLIRHIAGLTLTIPHLTGGAAANRFFNGSAGTTVVLGIGGQALYWYDILSAYWTLISYTA